MTYQFIARSYNLMTNAEYGRSRSYWKRTAFVVNERFENYFYNAIGQAITHSDPSHLADVIMASRELGKYRSISRVIHAMKMPWAFSECEKPNGNVPKANKQRLAYLRINWQLEFAQAMDKEEVNVQKPIELNADKWWEEKASATILRLVKTAKEKGMNKTEIQEHVLELLNKAA